MSLYQVAYPRFEDLDAHVLGISPDASPGKAAWARSLGGISFDLLSDFHPHGAVAERYGVLRPDGTPDRSIFVVDKAGRVAFARKYDSDTLPDPADLYAALEAIPI